MKYTDHGFRPLYKNFCIYPLNSVLKEVLKDQKGIEEANGVLVYGYVDHAEGNKVELIALAKSTDNEKYAFSASLPEDERFSVNLEDIIDEEFFFANYGNSAMAEQFKAKIAPLSQYEEEAIAESRKMTFLDEFRYDKNFDVVKVVLMKEGLGLEGVWVSIEALGEGVLMGTLLNDPTQDFGVKGGMPIAFIVHEDKEKKRNLVANLTPRSNYTAEDLADGKMLKNALVAFEKSKNQYKLFTILEILRDSKVVVPYNKNGVEILTSKDGRNFFPVFSDMIETWILDDSLTKKEMTFMEALEKAKNKKNLTGIVVNAYSDSFNIPKSMYELIEGLPSKLEQ